MKRRTAPFSYLGSLLEAWVASPLCHIIRRTRFLARDGRPSNEAPAGDSPNRKQPWVPDYLPMSLTEVPVRLPAMALELYRRLAECERAVEQERERAAEELERHRRETSRLLARLAAERFDFERLLDRVLPDLAGAGREDLGDKLRLFARSWDAELERARVEVRDLTGDAVTDELAEIIEVEGVVPDPGTSQAVVREALSPLVLWQDRVVGLSKVITSVPASPSMESETGSSQEES